MKFCVSFLPSTFSVVVVSLIFFVSFPENVAPAVNAPLQCYQCVEGVDKNCKDPLNVDEAAKDYLKPCNTKDARPTSERFLPNVTAIGCRKIDQEIDDIVHVVRECAFSGEDVHNLKRTGNKGVRLYYNQCSNLDGCNSAPTSFAEAKTFFAIFFSIFLAFILRS